MSHTPGQWIAVGAWVEHDDDNVADICTCDPAAMGQAHLTRSVEELMANARLIAAAPDLIEALETLLEAVEGGLLDAQAHRLTQRGPVGIQLQCRERPVSPHRIREVGRALGRAL